MQSSCLNLPRTGIIGVHHHTQLTVAFMLDSCLKEKSLQLSSKSMCNQIYTLSKKDYSMVWEWFVPERFMYWRLGPQRGSAEAVEPLRGGAQCQLIKSLGALPSEGINVGLRVSSEWVITKPSHPTHLAPSIHGWLLFCLFTMM